MSVQSTPMVTDAALASHTQRRQAGVIVAREAVLMAAVYVGYRHVRHLARDQAVQAFDNARLIVDLERQLHVFTERSVQQAVVHHDALMWLVNHYYARVHFPITVLFLVWLLLRRRRAYRLVRTWLIIVTLTALVIHVAFPLAPPRMLPSLGFVDTLRESGLRIYSANPNDSVANQFAAMPSLHFGWSLIVAAAFVTVHRSVASLLVIVHPLVTLFAIVATANHFWMDAAVALVLVGGAAILVRWMDRRSRSRPPDTVHAAENSAYLPIASIPGTCRFEAPETSGSPTTTRSRPST